MLFAHATRWLCVPRVERRIVLIAFLCTLPSLAMGLHADDYILREQVLEGGPWYQAAMRASRGEVGPPVFALYAGAQSLEIQRIDDRSLELHAARSWFSTPFERIRDVARAPFRAGDRIALAHFTVEVREVDAAGAPTRALFTFDRSLDDPGLSFRFWEGSTLALWTPPPAGGRGQLAAAAVF